MKSLFALASLSVLAVLVAHPPCRADWIEYSYTATVQGPIPAGWPVPMQPGDTLTGVFQYNTSPLGLQSLTSNGPGYLTGGLLTVDWTQSGPTVNLFTSAPELQIQVLPPGSPLMGSAPGGGLLVLDPTAVGNQITPALQLGSSTPLLALASGALPTSPFAPSLFDFKHLTLAYLPDALPPGAPGSTPGQAPLFVEAQVISLRLDGVVATAPEPGSLTLMFLGGGLLWGACRRVRSGRRRAIQ